MSDITVTVFDKDFCTGHVAFYNILPKMYEQNKNVPTVTSFAELTKQVHLINDLILADMICDDFDNSTEVVIFSKHLLATKYWFARISHPNKKRYLLALVHDVRSAWALSLLLKSMWNCQPKDAVLSVSDKHLLATKYWFARISHPNKKQYLLALVHDVRSAWALSLLLKSMWNCQPKDAVLSVSEPKVYSSYDQVPMDHNRTAMPASTLAQVMKNDRFWFHTLEPESQALVLSELSIVAGGPIMWAVLKLARKLFDRNRDLMLKNIAAECIVVADNNPQVSKPGGTGDGDAKQATVPPPPGEAQKALDANLMAWNATIKSMRDSLKLEEIEMTFNDGSKKKIWKVNRPKPESIETVDFIQLLPSKIGKKILSYLPRTQLGEYAKVNKYWVYLVDELRTELATRAKITADIERLHELVCRHDETLEVFLTHDDHIGQLNQSIGVQSAVSMGKQRNRPYQPSLRPSEKSAGAYSQRNFITEKLTRPMIILKPLLNMADLTERLERRGAVDENIWKWCNCLLAHAKKSKKLRKKKGRDGVLSLGNVHFPCPLMNISMDVPVFPPLYKDPVMITSAKPKKVMSVSHLDHVPKETIKRYTLWARNHSPLYHVFKIPSYLNTS